MNFVPVAFCERGAETLATVAYAEHGRELEKHG